jgi:hypothetical protein
MPSLHGFIPTSRPTSELREYLESTRAAYLERFTRAVARRSKDAGRALVEQLVELPMPDEPDQIFRLMRADILAVEGEEATVETVSGPFAIEDLLFDFAGVPVTVHDLAWESAQFSVRGPLPSGPALAMWGALWMDVADERAPDATGLRHAIHRLERPHASEDGWSIRVDFGTADVDAFIEFLEIASSDAAAIDIWIPG